MIFKRRCRLCGLRSRQVKVWHAPISDYLTWKTWRCENEEACRVRQNRYIDQKRLEMSVRS